MDIKNKLTSKLKDIYVDEEGAPNKKAFGLSFLVVVLVIGGLIFLSKQQIKETAGGIVNLDFGVPAKKEKSSVQFNDDSKYVTKNDLGKLVKDLNNDNSITTEQLQRILDQQQKNMILQMRKERQKQLKNLKTKINGDNTNKNNKDRNQKNNQNLNNNNYQNEPQNHTQNNQLNNNNSTNNRGQRNNFSNNQGSGSLNQNSFTAPGSDYSDPSTNNSNARNNNKQSFGGSVIAGNDQTGGSVLISKSFKKESPGYSVGFGVPVGTMIPSRLKVGLVSSKERVTAIANVTKDIKYKGEVIIPRGSIFYGYATADYSVRQMFVTLERLIIGDREIDIKAKLVKADGTPGFCSKYIDIQKREHWYTTLAHFAAGVFYL